MKPTLLMADSDTDLCDIYQRFFRERGFEVQTASESAECLAKLRATVPAAIVLDLDMLDRGNGVRTWLREESRPGSVILTATAEHSPGMLDNLDRRAAAFLPKPFALSALLASVRAILARDTEDPPTLESGTLSREHLERIAAHVQRRLTTRVRNFRLSLRDEGLVLQGTTNSYYSKQLAQHAVMEAARLPIRANDIEVV